MRRNDLLFLILFFSATGLVTALLTGCDAPEAPEVAREALVASPWRLGSADYVAGWSSGKTSSLSAWKSINCPDKYGVQFLLTALTGYKEPASNLDHFIAKLQATCTEFNQASQSTATVFSAANHRDTAFELDLFDWQAHQDTLCPAYYFDDGPLAQATVGKIEIFTDLSHDYVKDFRLFPRCVKRASDDTLTWWTPTYGVSNVMISDGGYYGGDRTQLSCPGEDYVGSGVELRYDTSNGKIRDFRLVCRKLTYVGY